jgi:hypothetical protein
LAKLAGASVDKVETNLILLVALLVEMGGLGPFITMNLAKGPRSTKIPAAEEPILPNPTAETETSLKQTIELSPSAGRRPRLVFSAGRTNDLKGDLRNFLNVHTREEEGSALGSTGLLTHYNDSRRTRGLHMVSQRRFGDAMSSLGHRKKVRRSSGHVHYQGLAWLEPTLVRSVA